MRWSQLGFSPPAAQEIAARADARGGVRMNLAESLGQHGKQRS